jgi:hypothetical protein
MYLGADAPQQRRRSGVRRGLGHGIQRPRRSVPGRHLEWLVRSKQTRNSRVAYLKNPRI